VPMSVQGTSLDPNAPEQNQTPMGPMGGPEGMLQTMRQFLPMQGAELAGSGAISQASPDPAATMSAANGAGPAGDPIDKYGPVNAGGGMSQMHTPKRASLQKLVQGGWRQLRLPT
jgi:hypothetical protein